MPPQATVIFARAVIVGKAAGLTVIIRVTGSRVRPHTSVPVQVSVTVPPQTPGVAVKVEVFELPFNRHPPVKLLLYDIVLPVGMPPQATVIFDGAGIVGKAAGKIWIVREVVKATPQTAVLQVSVISSPQAVAEALNDEVTVPLI